VALFGSNRHPEGAPGAAGDESGLITLEDIEGTLVMASATISLPQPFDPLDPDKGLRRLSAEAKRAKPSRWLIASSALVRALIGFIARASIQGAGACAGGKMVVRAVKGPASRTRLH
jgi:hypothetical protein